MHAHKHIYKTAIVKDKDTKKENTKGEHDERELQKQKFADL